tara:strand:- start:97 stop:351 length:255 start_codon:yes stop_codon:yes gene_type:complete
MSKETIKLTIEISHPALDSEALFDAFQAFIESDLHLSDMVTDYVERQAMNQCDAIDDEAIEAEAEEMEEALREELSQALCVSLV